MLFYYVCGGIRPAAFWAGVYGFGDSHDDSDADGAADRAVEHHGNPGADAAGGGKESTVFHSLGGGGGFPAESGIDSKIRVFRGGICYGYGGIRRPGHPMCISAEYGQKRDKEGKRRQDSGGNAAGRFGGLVYQALC